MRNVSDRIYWENKKIRWIRFFSPENLAFHEITWKNTVDPNWQQMTIWRMHIACCVPKVTVTHSEYVHILLFPLQNRSRERTLTLRYTYIKIDSPASSGDKWKYNMYVSFLCLQLRQHGQCFNIRRLSKTANELIEANEIAINTGT
jgi:hypothetical protein